MTGHAIAAACPGRARPRRQAGAGLIGLLYVLATLGLIVLFLIYSIPVFMTSYAVAGALAGAANDAELIGASRQAIHRSVEKRLATSYVENVSADDLVIKNVRGGRLLQIKYSVNRPFIWNVGLHYEFDKRAVLRRGNDE